jgi:hypothetical protein
MLCTFMRRMIGGDRVAAGYAQHCCTFLELTLTVAGFSGLPERHLDCLLGMRANV